MEAVGMSVDSRPSTSFLCSKSLHPLSSSSSSSLRTQLVFPPIPKGQSLKLTRIFAGSSAESQDLAARTVASEKAVEGINQQLHQTARMISHDDSPEKVQELEAKADVASDQASSHAAAAAAEPDSNRPDNVGSGHEEGKSAAEKMTPKAK